MLESVLEYSGVLSTLASKPYGLQVTEKCVTMTTSAYLVTLSPDHWVSRIKPIVMGVMPIGG